MTTRTTINLIHALHGWSEPNSIGVYPFLPHDIVRSITELALIDHREVWRKKYIAERFGSAFKNPCIGDADAVERRNIANNFIRVLNENWMRETDDPGWCPPIRQRWDEDWGIEALRKMGALIGLSPHHRDGYPPVSPGRRAGRDGLWVRMDRRRYPAGIRTKISISAGHKFIGTASTSRSMWEQGCRECSLNFYLNQPRNRFRSMLL